MKDINNDLFIKEIQKRPALYDRSLREYGDKGRKKQLWLEIAEIVTHDWKTLSTFEKRERINEVRKKWKNLRTCFSRELRLAKEMQSQDISSDSIRKRRKYIYFDQLLFLLPCLDDQETASNFYTLFDSNDAAEDKSDEREDEIMEDDKMITDVASEIFGEMSTEVTEDPTGITMKFETESTFDLPTECTVTLPTESTIDLPTGSTTNLPTEPSFELSTESNFKLRKEPTIKLPTESTSNVEINSEVPRVIIETVRTEEKIPKKKQTRKTAKVKNKQPENNYEERLLKILEDTKRRPAEEIDEDRYFLLSLVPIFKKLNEGQKFVAKTEILHALHRVQASDCPTPSYLPSTFVSQNPEHSCAGKSSSDIAADASAAIPVCTTSITNKNITVDERPVIICKSEIFSPQPTEDEDSDIS